MTRIQPAFAQELPYLALLFILPFPGTVAMRLLLLCTACFVSFRFRRSWEIPPLPLKWALSAWTLVAVVSLTYAVDPAYSLGEIKNEIGYSMAIFAAFFAFSRSGKHVQAAAWSVIAATCVIAIWGGARHLRDGHWEDGIAGFATLAVTSFAMSVVLWPQSAARSRGILVLALVLVVCGVVLSEQRIVWIVWGIQGCILAVMRQFHPATRIPPARLVLAIVALATLAGTAMLSIHSRKVNESPVEYRDLRNDVRLVQWKKIAGRILEHPLAGSGFGREGMKKAHPDLVPSKSPMSLMWHPHNVFLTYGIAMGIPGMLALMALFGALFRRYMGTLAVGDAPVRSASLAGCLLVCGVVMRNLTNDLFMRDGALMFWALNGALLGYLARSRRVDD